MTERELDNTEVISVGLGEWREGHDGDKLITERLGPCIGIAIYEPASKKGFLLHEPSPEEVRGTYEKFEDRLREVFSDQPGSFSRMQAWLSGGSDLFVAAINPEAAELVAQSRQFVEEAMQYIGIPRESIHINWAADYISAGMALDCTTGSCEISFSTSLSR
jgi:chemotaxis receptor (MCP) glutamine deamidase CheD